jgi:hypothetical protein
MDMNVNESQNTKKQKYVSKIQSSPKVPLANETYENEIERTIRKT